MGLRTHSELENELVLKENHLVQTYARKEASKDKYSSRIAELNQELKGAYAVCGHPPSPPPFHKHGGSQ